MNNAYYFSRLSPIGGIETFLYQLCKTNQNKNIVFYYKSADIEQLKRLSKYCTCEVYKGQKIKCDKFFCNFNLDPLIDGNVEAKEKILVIHGNYDWVGAEKVPKHPEIDRVIAVSKDSAEAYTRLTGIPCEVCYNPLELDEPNKVLTLMSATRLDPYTENIKGTARIEKMLEALDKYCAEHGTDYMWLMFSTNSDVIKHPKLLFMEPRINLSGFQVKSDYGIQLSDNVEGFCYTTHEFLSYGIPMVLTPCNVYKECNITENMAIFLDFDCSNIDEVVKKMYTKKFNFSYSPPKSNWNKILGKSKKTKIEPLKTVIVTATGESKKHHIKIADTSRIMEPGEKFETTVDRLPILRGDNSYGYKFIEE